MPQASAPLTICLLLVSVGACSTQDNLEGVRFGCTCNCSACGTQDGPFGPCTGQSVLASATTCAETVSEATEACGDACSGNDGWGVAICVGDGCSSPVKFKFSECEFTGAVSAVAASCQSGSFVRMSTPTGDSTVASVIESTAFAELLFQGKRGSFTPRGRVTLAGGFCVTPPCLLRLQRFDLTSTNQFTVDGTAVTGLQIDNSGVSTGTVAADGTITFTEFSAFDTSARVGNTFNSRRGTVRSMSGRLDSATRRIHLEGELAIQDGSAVFSFDAQLAAPPPATHIDGPLTAECGDPVTLSAERSFSPAGVALTAFDWFEQFDDHRTPLGTGATLTRSFAKGEHVIGVHVTDANGRRNFAFIAPLRVADTQPPVIDSLTTNTVCLWPPNHKLVPLVLGTDVTAVVHDVCDGPAAVLFTSATSDQPVDRTGDGATSPDAVVAAGGQSVCLRAERSGNSAAGRTYTLGLVATDLSGHASTGTIRVGVPHDQGGPAQCTRLGPERQVELSDPRCVPAAPLPAAGVVEVPAGERTGGCSLAGGGSTAAVAALFALWAALGRTKVRRRSPR